MVCLVVSSFLFFFSQLGTSACTNYVNFFRQYTSVWKRNNRPGVEDCKMETSRRSASSLPSLYLVFIFNTFCVDKKMIAFYVHALTNVSANACNA